ncbi:MAG: hypothetical protein AB7P03_05850 [Kofleriaceae bacterium]
MTAASKRSVQDILAEIPDMPEGELADLETQLMGHVRNAIDFSALDQLEQLLWGLIDQHGIYDEDGAVAKGLILAAAVRAHRDPASYFPVSPPPGITKAEAKAAEFDENCPFCVMEAEQAEYERNAPPDDFWDKMADEFKDSARAWREQHADALKRFRLR